jgi:hypothetical protein
MEVLWAALSLTLQEPSEGFDVSHRVIDRMVIVGSDAESLPGLDVAEDSDEAGIEVTDASA